jgi:hypothetical protein
MRSRKDWTIVRRATDNGFVFVTNNTTDFTALYERQEIHAGLICLNVAPGLMRLEVQKTLFRFALDRLDGAEPINEVVEVSLRANGKIAIARYRLPQP